MKRRVVTPFLMLLGLLLFEVAVGIPPARAEEGWKAEFDAVCAKTDVAMTLSVAELSERIERCDQLKKRLAGEDESTRKVYLRRIQMCQDLYRYVLQSKGTDR
jgi:hypothetical protein